MLEVRGLSLSFENPLLIDVSFTIRRGERVALIGPNGSGKSTLLRILAGEIPDAGRAIAWQGGRPEVAYLRQEDGSSVDALSAGQRMRRRVGEAIARQPQVLLLDEPTNHLDEDAAAWLAKTLRRFPGTVLFVSHNRRFIDLLATRILHLERGHLKAYSGNYSDFERERSADRQAQSRQHRDWQVRRDAVREAGLRQRNWAEIAHRRAGERNPYGKKRAAQLMQKAVATERRLQRLEAERVEKPFEQAELSFAFLPARRLPNVLVHAQDLSFTYPGAPLPTLRGVTLDLRRGERLWLEGKNGSGKTTLLRLILQAAGLDRMAGRIAGELRVHPGAALLHFAQEQVLDPGPSMLAQMLRAGAPDAATARTLLGHFHVTGDAALRPAGTLSPGEQARAACAAALVRGADILLLDEPTNHLDIEGRTALEEALRAYPGTVLFASHDRLFGERAATRSLRLGESPPAQMPGEPQRRDILQMRLSALLSRQERARGAERERIASEITELVKELQGTR